MTSVLGIATTHVDRVVFPDVGITKGELIAYYADVAPLMVPELRGRPLTRVRSGGVYQKHWQRHYPPWIDSVEIGGKTVVRYPIADSAEALVYFANQGAIELHVTTARKGSLEAPDLIVVDLDPPEGGFALTRRAARIVREWLEARDLVPFVKTTGGKGLHVVAPVAGRVGELVALAAQELTSRHPDVFTTEFHKVDRHGRVYLDLGRNFLGATFVAAYSVRERPGAPVSMPIAWSELDDPALAGDSVKLRDVRARLNARGDAWADLRARRG